MNEDLAEQETFGYDIAPTAMSNPPPLIKQLSNTIKRRHTYELYAMIIHKGDTGSGHYYSLIRHPSGSWFNFNDDEISLIKHNDKLLQLSQ